MNLNDVELFRRVDASSMLGYIDALPDQLRDAWSLGQSLDLLPEWSNVRRLVICGMGGSAISGDLLAALARDTARCLFVVNRDYDLPAWVTGKETLVVSLSHSGTTEETLAATEQAIARGTQALAITTGGDLAPLTERAGGLAWTYTYPSQPRAALGWLYGLLLAACSRLGLIPDQAADVEESIHLMEEYREILGASTPDAKNPAKRIAGQMVERTVVIWAAGLLAPVAMRWKTQLNENSKSRAYFELLPELNHNAVVGLDYPADLRNRFAMIQLVSSCYEHPRVALRHQITADVLREQGIVTDTITARGESRLANQFSLIQFGDYVSYYLAMAYQVDPTPIDNIVLLKQKLARQ